MNVQPHGEYNSENNEVKIFAVNYKKYNSITPYFNYVNNLVFEKLADGIDHYKKLWDRVIPVPRPPREPHPISPLEIEEYLGKIKHFLIKYMGYSAEKSDRIIHYSRKFSPPTSRKKRMAKYRDLEEGKLNELEFQFKTPQEAYEWGKRHGYYGYPFNAGDELEGEFEIQWIKGYKEGQEARKQATVKK
jgi:hypothetical protein